MIGRASDLHFQGSDQEGLPLWEKILLILEELFPGPTKARPDGSRAAAAKEGEDEEMGDVFHRRPRPGCPRRARAAAWRGAIHKA